MPLAAPEKGKRPPVFGDPRPAINSLFGEILDWMLAPLLLVWPISIAATHHVADRIADQAFDGQLIAQVERIVQGLRITPGGVFVTSPELVAASPQVEIEGTDRFYLQVASGSGEVLAGDPSLPGLRGGDPTGFGEVHLRDGHLMGEPVRIAYRLLPSPDDARPILVQAAETRRERKALSSSIISGVLLPQFAVIPLAALLVWLGLSRGLRPLERLRERFRDRRAGDLSPIDLATVPDELQPIVAAFNDMMMHLRDNLEAQRRFISAAAHQLKTPLTGLKTQVEIALRETDPIRLRENLERIATGVDRSARLTLQLLRLTRAEASHRSAAQGKELVDLVALAREAVTLCVARALARNIDIGFEDPGYAMHVPGVPLLLCEMIDNLVDNAIKYTPKGGAVTVRLRRDAGWIVEVEDTGIGIAPDDRERVFERFYRVLGTPADGSGLGLAIVREIADLHGASVAILDNPRGRGTLVRLVFPMTEG